MMRLVVSAVFIVVMVASQASGQYCVFEPSKIDWTWVNPLPQGNPLLDIVSTDSSMIAVGRNAVVLVSRDQGDSWTIDTELAKYDCDFTNICWTPGGKVLVGGITGNLLVSEDHGTTWYTATFAPNVRAIDIAFVSDRIGYALGLLVKPETSEKVYHLLQTNDGGRSWETTGVIESKSWIWSIAFSDPLNGFAVGSGGKLYRISPEGELGPPQHVCKGTNLYDVEFYENQVGCAVGGNGTTVWTHDSGKTWVKRETGHNLELKDVEFQGDGQVYIAGDASILRSDDLGKTWAREAQGTHAQEIDFDNWGVGISVGDGGIIQRSRGGGGRWRAVTTGTNDDLRALAFFSSMSGIAVGWGTAMYTIDESTLAYEGILNKNDFIEEFFITKNDLAFAVGRNGLVMRSNDGGSNWINLPTETEHNLLDIYMVDDNRGCVVGKAGTVLTTSDGGDSWHQAQSSVDAHLLGVHLHSSGVGYAVGVAKIILRAEDVGGHWEEVYCGSGNALKAVCSPSEDCVLAVGTGGDILYSEDGGGNWTSIGSGTTIALNDIDVRSDGIALAAGNSGLVLVSCDPNYLIWVEAGCPASSPIYSCEFVTDSQAIVVGYNGLMLRADFGD